MEMFFAASTSCHDDAGDSSVASTLGFIVAMDASARSMEARIVVADSWEQDFTLRMMFPPPPRLRPLPVLRRVLLSWGQLAGQVGNEEGFSGGGGAGAGKGNPRDAQGN
eukprot:8323680-Pyramimonas_sp.AAC.1